MAISMSIVRCKDFDVNRLGFGETSDMDGTRLTSILYDGKPLVMQLPEVYSPFGINTYVPKGSSAPKDPLKWTCEVSFRDMHVRPALMRMYEVLQQLEDRVATHAVRNRDTCLIRKVTHDAKTGRPLDDELLRAKMISCIRPERVDVDHPDRVYPPLFKMSVPLNRETRQFSCRAFDEARQRFELDPGAKLDRGALPGTRGATIVPVIMLSKIWASSINNGCFGINVKLREMIIKPALQAGTCAITIDDDDMILPAAPSARPAGAPLIAPPAGEYDDDEGIGSIPSAFLN
jgi:hypothetical protein